MAKGKRRLGENTNTPVATLALLSSALAHCHCRGLKLLRGDTPRTVRPPARGVIAGDTPPAGAAPLTTQWPAALQ